MGIEVTNPSAPPAEMKTPTIVLHYWGRRGGGSEFTYSLGQRLRDQGAINITLSLAQQNVDVGRFEVGGFRILTFDRPSMSTLWRQVWALPRTLRTHADTIAALKPDAVIMTMNAPFAWPFISMLQRRGVKVIYVAHDAEPHPGDYAVTWQRITQDLLMKRADKIVALSNSVSKQIEDRIPAVSEKLVVIPLEAAYSSKSVYRLKDYSTSEPIRFLFYGRLLSYKGLDLLAQSLESLRADPAWRLTIAGSGPLEPYLRQVFSTWPQVDLELGWISDERAEELFASHQLLLCPYVEASQSGVIAQALSWAMPSLVMPTGALPEQIGYGVAGLIAETIDAKGLQRALQVILDQPSSIREFSKGAAELSIQRQRNQEWIKLCNQISAGS